MALVLFGLLFSLLVNGGLSTDNIAVGTACPSGDTCVAHAVCDQVQAKCLIIHGQSCAGNTDKCVSNATCDNNVCKCDATIAINSTTGLCLLKTGQACTDKSHCVVGATCKTSPCQCSTDYEENTTTKLCEAKAGTACSSDVTCVASSICESGKCAIIHGQSCAGNSDKCVSSATCDNNVCKCNATIAINSTTGVCLLKTGQPCTDKSNCVVGATCKTSPCQCSGDYVENTTTKLCEAKAGTACSSDVTCVASSTCESGKCAPKNKANNSATLSFWLLLLAALMSMSLADHVM